MRLQPVHSPNTPNHTPSRPKANRPSKPTTHKPSTRPAGQSRNSDDRGGKSAKKGKKSQKSAPATERTMPIGSGARVSIASLGVLPATYRRH